MIDNVSARVLSVHANVPLSDGCLDPLGTVKVHSSPLLCANSEGGSIEHLRVHLSPAAPHARTIVLK